MCCLKFAEPIPTRMRKRGITRSSLIPRLRIRVGIDKRGAGQQVLIHPDLDILTRVERVRYEPAWCAGFIFAQLGTFLRRTRCIVLS